MSLEGSAIPDRGNEGKGAGALCTKRPCSTFLSLQPASHSELATFRSFAAISCLYDDFYAT